MEKESQFDPDRFFRPRPAGAGTSPVERITALPEEEEEEPELTARPRGRNRFSEALKAPFTLPYAVIHRLFEMGAERLNGPEAEIPPEDFERLDAVAEGQRENTLKLTTKDFGALVGVLAVGGLLGAAAGGTVKAIFGDLFIPIPFFTPGVLAELLTVTITEYKFISIFTRKLKRVRDQKYAIEHEGSTRPKSKETLFEKPFVYLFMSKFLAYIGINTFESILSPHISDPNVLVGEIFHLIGKAMTYH